VGLSLRGKKVAVERIKTANKETQASFIVMPENEEFCGLIRAVGPGVSPDLTVGMKVYFNTNFQYASIEGSKLCIMEESEIYGISQN
jgi:co-chaperonin GroES (HSP10)